MMTLVVVQRRLGSPGAVALMCCMALALASPLAARAATHTLTISETARDVTVTPGGVYEGVFAAANQSDVDMQIAVKAVPYSVHGSSYQPDFSVRPTDTHNATSWVSFSSDYPLVLRPKAVHDIKYKVSVPASAQPGGYSLVIFVEPLATGAGSLSVSGRAGNIIYINVSGGVQPVAGLKPVKFSPILFGGQLELAPVVSNTGGAHLTAVVRAAIYPVTGSAAWQEQQTRRVLPGTERSFQFTGRVEPLMGVGVYRVSQAVEHGNTAAIVANQWVCIVTPRGIIIIGVALGFGIALARYVLVKKHKAKKS